MRYTEPESSVDMRITTPAPRGVWWELCNADQNALVFQTPSWLDCICRMGNYEDASRLYELPAGRRMVLPMVRRKGLPGALAAEASMPHGWGMGGLVSDQPVRPEEIRQVFADLAGRRVLCTSIRPNALSADPWAAAAPEGAKRVQRLTHILDLEGGFQQVWEKRFPSATRTKVRRAEKQPGLVVECGSSGRLEQVFYDLYLRWLERRTRERQLPLPGWLGQLREPQRKLQLVSQSLGYACRFWVAWLKGRPAAAGILLVFGGHAIYWRSAMDKDLAGPTRVNDLLQRMMIEDACRAGCRYYHMGESGGVESLMQFKSRFGAQVHQYTEYRLERVPINWVQDWFEGITRLADQRPRHPPRKTTA